ncbi:MAG: ArsR/SmtB family transcription factor [Candidatus Thorarchaeota archaeon]
MAPPTRTFKHLLLWLFTGTRGGPNRARIIDVLREEPMNTNQLRIHLGLDYRTVKHHLEVLVDNELIYSMGGGYGSMFFLTPRIEEHMDEFDEIWEKINKKINGEGDEE